MASPIDESPELRPESERRTKPDRGIVLLQAKDRIGPFIWALYGKVERPVILKDDLYIDNSLNDFYRDEQGRCFLLLPYVSDDDPKCFEVADAAYRRAVALGVVERPEIFFTCVYQFQLPEYRCIDIHSDSGNEILEVDKCITLLNFEKARLGMASKTIGFELVDRKIKPVVMHADQEPSINMEFALNSLALHHEYDAAKLTDLWSRL